MTEPSLDRLLKDVRRVLNNPFWIPELEVDKLYERLHDDHDGRHVGTINVSFTRDGDAWININESQPHMLRFRTFGGGGHSPRVRNALMILALAIKQDNEESPQDNDNRVGS